MSESAYFGVGSAYPILRAPLRRRFHSEAMRLLAGGSVVLLLAGFASGDGNHADMPRNARARDALAKHDAAVKKLRYEYLSKLIEADSQLLKELDAALKAAAAAGADVSEIQRIAAARANAQDMLKRDSEQVRGGRVFVINADAGWQPTVDLRRGDVVSIQASGTWSWDRKNPAHVTGADGDGNGSPAWGSLIAIMSGQPDDAATQIGSNHEFVASVDGILQLSMKGHAPIGSGLNAGSLEVLIKVVSQNR